jgi:AbrB family looped-hinge helix DNA binding protein
MPGRTKITSKGQVTIPKQVRDRQNIAAGTEFEVIERGDEIVLLRRKGASPGQRRDDPEFAAYLERVRGSMNLGLSTDEFMEFLRGE